MSTTEFFRLKAPEAPWGDYGSILQDGMTAHLGRNADGVLQLERTGPFLPPISFPGIGDVIVTSSMRELLDGSGLTGFDYGPVHKALIVRLDWHLWDRDAESPAVYPEDGEPEGYILGRPHSQDTAAALGHLWELRIVQGAAEIRSNGAVFLRESSWTGIDFFRGTETAYNYVSARARDWLDEKVHSFVRFVEVAVVP